MTDRAANAEPKDPRVEAALREYLERMDRGEPIDREEFLARHAEVAGELRSFLAAEQAIGRLAGAEAPHGQADHSSTRSFTLHGQETMAPQIMGGGKAEGDQTGLKREFGRYRIVRTLGQGAMGTVYLAEDTQLHRQVALKTPHFTDILSKESVERFYREARAAANLRHPNICPVYDVGLIEGTHYISMAYIEGHSLSAFIRMDKPQSERQILIIVRKLAMALQEAHDQGIVHRDLKPANIMVDKRGEPIIMDFGLARQVKRDDNIRITQSGMLVGTPAYMAPEQVEGEPGKIVSQTDQYSLGVILYELLTAQLPFRGSIMAVMGQILTKEPPLASHLRPGLDPRIEAICRKMMAKTPAERFASLSTVAEELAAILRNPAARPVPADKPAVPPIAGGRQAESAIVKTMSGKDLASLEELAGKCLARRDYDQVIQIIDRIPEEKRNPSLQTILQESRAKADEIAFLICEIDEAIRLDDGHAVLRKADELLKIKPGHHRALQAQQQFGGFGTGGASRIGPLRQFTRPWNDGGWIPWSVLVFGLAVFGVATKAIMLSVGGTAEPKKMDTVASAPGNVPEKIGSVQEKKKDGIEKRFDKASEKKIAVADELRPPLLVAPFDAAAAKNARRTAPVSQTGFVPLFNGKDLTGWKTHTSQPGNWRVKQGTLIGSGAPYSHLYTERDDYTDFHLRVEARLNEGGNSGVYFRARFGPINPLAPPLGYEAEINNPRDIGSNRTGTLWAIPGGGLVRFLEPLVPAGQWFTMEVTAEGNHIVIKVNDKTTADYVDENRRYASGHIALQQAHEETVVELRRIEIKELGSIPPTTHQQPRPAKRVIRRQWKGTYSSFEKTRPGQWRETRDRDRAVFNFVEVAQTTDYLEMIDKSRGKGGVRVRLHDDQMQMIWGGKDKDWRPMQQGHWEAGDAAASGSSQPFLVAPFNEFEAKKAQQEWSDRLKAPVELVNSIGTRLRLIPPGQFRMGSDKETRDKKPAHEVRITRPVYFGMYEVTRGEFAKFVAAARFKTQAERQNGGWRLDNSEKTTKWEPNHQFTWRHPGFQQEKNHPVVEISWDDAQAFCEWLSHKEAKTYRLPTEAEWEYVCRAGTPDWSYNGGNPEGRTEIGNIADAKAATKFSLWRTVKSSDGWVYTSPVGLFRPNNFGIHDTIGNAREWCSDWYGQDYYKDSPESDPPGPPDGKFRLSRGGSFVAIPTAIGRKNYRPNHHGPDTGFRVVCEIPSNPSAVEAGSAGAPAVNSPGAPKSDSRR